MDRFVLKRKAPSQNPDDINWEEEIQYDPGQRKKIEDYHPNLKDLVRRKYLVNGPCQPRTYEFPQTLIGESPRRFNPEWFDEFGSWLEYSESKDKAYCFCCFLFRDRSSKKEAGYEAFVVKGWNAWHRKSRLKDHIGDVGSIHNQALKSCDALLRRDQHIDVAIQVQSEAAKAAYFTRLNSSIDTARLLLKQGLPFRGHDESNESLNKGNFREFRDALAEHNPAYGKALGQDAAGNSIMVSPEVQKDIASSFAGEIMSSILKEIGHGVFCLLVDESRDVSCKEQMAVVLRYVNSSGIVKESFVCLVHVKETTSSYLKSSIDSLFSLPAMVETRKHICYPLVYRLLNLVLVLPVATATVERCFSAMKLVKTYLCNHLNDDSLSDNVICYVEKEEMKKVTNNQVVDRFMKIRNRKY